jgi:hypothetical protein
MTEQSLLRKCLFSTHMMGVMGSLIEYMFASYSRTLRKCLFSTNLMGAFIRQVFYYSSRNSSNGNIHWKNQRVSRCCLRGKRDLVRSKRDLVRRERPIMCGVCVYTAYHIYYTCTVNEHT